MKSEAQLFLPALFAGKPDDSYILIWTLDKQSHWFRNVRDAIQFVESPNGLDTYVGIGLSTEDRGPHRRGASADVGGIVGIAIDIDLRSIAHQKSTLPGTVEEALSLLPPELPPTFIVLTGNGIHVWWLFREPWVFENNEARERAATVLKRWATLVRDNGRARGWSLERLADLARVFRIPGTTNYKDPANPKPVTISLESDRRYNPSDLIELLDEYGVPDDEAEEAAKKKFVESFQDKPLRIDFDAEIPASKLERWLAANQRFKKTWFRQRNDLVDQSQSGYDLALANFGFRVGLGEQEIVDLLLHHRRIHKGRRRTGLDYFARTLSKARRNPQGDWLDLRAAENRPSENFPEEPAEETPAKQAAPQLSDRDKIQLCKKISAVLGFEILRVVKLSGADPIYRIECPEGTITFPGAGKLMQQSFFRQVIAARVGKVVPKLRGPAWDNLVQLVLDACIVEDGGEEMESQGAIRTYIDQYLDGNTLICTVEELVGPDKYRPMIRNGRIAICSGDLQLFLNRATQQNLSIREIVGMLSAIKAKSVRVRSGIKEQGRWELPTGEFDPADYPGREGNRDEAF